MVRWTAEAEAALAEVAAACPPANFQSVPQLRAALEEVLRLDVRSVYRGRGTVTGESVQYNVAFDLFDVVFTTEEDGVVVRGCDAQKKKV